MKTIKIFALTVFGTIALASCKKDYTCNCSSGGFTVVAETYTSVTKSDAESKCADYETDVNAAFGGGVSCSIAKK